MDYFLFFMLFEYKAKNSQGETIEGTIDALNQDAAIEALTSREMIIISLTEGSSLPFWRRPLRLKILERVKTKDMVFLSRQLAVMVAAELPLVKSLEVLGRQTSNPFLKRVVGSIVDDVRGGVRFSTALSRHPRVFDDFYINMVRAGETAGKLDEVLTYLANEREKNFDLMSKLKGAMVYPAFVIVAVVGIMVLMMTFVIPQLTTILEEAGANLPLPTKVLIAISRFFQTKFVLIIVLFALLILGLYFFFKSKVGKNLTDRIILRLPVFGPLFQKVYIIRLTRSLATLIVGGIPISSGLKIVAGVVGNAVYQNTIMDAVVDVEEGRSVSSAFLDAPHIPKVLSSLMAIGEQTGRLDEVLEKIADFYGREIENTLSKLVTLLEPMIIILLGGIVGGMVAAIILPMYQLASTF